MGFVLILIRNAVEGVMSSITTLLNRVTQEVTSPLRMMINQVTGGEWTGDGADRFVNEMNTEVLVELRNMISINNSFSGAIRKSLNVFDQAEKTALSKVNDLGDIFGNIFKG
jgi:hypothetical protein